jgi:predicted nucleotidyltransferase
MDLSNPLAVLTPTLDAGVLQVLAATTGWCTAGEVHRRLGRASDAGVRRVLERLVGQGIVTADRSHRFPLYTLNRDHVAFPHIEGLTRLRGEVVNRIRSELEEWAKLPLHASLFGSFARGEAHEESDIDILLVRPDALAEGDAEWLTQVSRLADLIEKLTGNRAQIIDIAPQTLGIMAREDDPLVGSWRADAVHLCGVRLLDLLRKWR